MWKYAIRTRKGAPRFRPFPQIKLYFKTFEEFHNMLILWIHLYR